MRITQKMIDAQREIRRLEYQEQHTFTRAALAGECFEDGWDACIAFLRANGALAHRVELPAEETR